MKSVSLSIANCSSGLNSAVPLRHNSNCASWASAIDNPAPTEATSGCCVGRIGADRKSNAHLRRINTTAPMPNIENLKKQAKQYLRWHRERYYPVAAQIRAALPRFRNVGDVQILESSFKLADACRAANGFRRMAGAQNRSRCHDR
jgi:hypothetical protein